MKTIFSPGPSYYDENVRQNAGWWHILELYKNGLEELGFKLFIPCVPPSLIDATTTVSKITSYDLVAASQSPLDADLFIGPPGYSLAQIMRLKGRPSSSIVVAKEGRLHPKTKVVTWVWNNADWWRDHQLADEYAKFGLPYDRSPTWRWINKTALELSDHVVACSPFVKKTHAKVVPADRISIAFWGVDSQKFTPAQSEQDGFRILFVGSDPIRKGLFYLIEAFRRMEGAELWVVGAQITVDLPNVKVFGMLPHEQMPGIFRQCHVQVQSTLEDGISLVVQEGMAAGVPCIGSDDVAEVFEDGVSGIRVSCRDIDGIYKALTMLKEFPEIRRKMGREARLLAEKQTWEQTKKDFKEIITRVVEGGSLPFES